MLEGTPASCFVLLRSGWLGLVTLVRPRLTSAFGLSCATRTLALGALSSVRALNARLINRVMSLWELNYMEYMFSAFTGFLSLSGYPPTHSFLVPSP